MPIFPLPQFESDLAEYRIEKEAYEKLSIPKTVVVRFGYMKMIGEFPFDLSVKPGCGTKMIARTHRGTELAEMLTSTCPNAGCGKSVTRKEMLEYIENSGGKDYPYFNEGKILRIATTDDLNQQRRIEGQRAAMKHFAQAAADTQGLKMKVVEAEPILGGERLTFYFTADDRVDFRDLLTALSREFGTRIDLRQVGARDEARLIADYEKCGQHCCCKQFLKVLKPISMKSAKIQKATLDPLKISGRCGRLMCCLRYEDESYESLRKRLPRMRSRVSTPEGVGTVVDAQILTQLVLVELDTDRRRVAVPVEQLSPSDKAPPPPVEREPDRRDRRESRPPRSGEAGAADAARRPGPAGEQEPGAPSGELQEDPLRGMSPHDAARMSGAPQQRREQRQERHRDRSQRPDNRRRDDRDARPPNTPSSPDVPGTQGPPVGGRADADGAEGSESLSGDAAPDMPGPGNPGNRDGKRRRRRRRRGGGGPDGPSGPRPQGPSSGPGPA